MIAELQSEAFIVSRRDRTVLARFLLKAATSISLQEFLKNPQVFVSVAALIDRYAIDKEFLEHWIRRAATVMERHAQTWEEEVNQRKLAGAKIIAPNGLPIRFVRSDGVLLEIEGADHEGYKFPITTEHVDDTSPEDSFIRSRRHAVVFVENHVCLTVFNGSYHLWSVQDGRALVGRLHDMKWAIANDSLKKIQRIHEWEVLPAERRAEWLASP